MRLHTRLQKVFSTNSSAFGISSSAHRYRKRLSTRSDGNCLSANKRNFSSRDRLHPDKSKPQDRTRICPGGQSGCQPVHPWRRMRRELLRQATRGGPETDHARHFDGLLELIPVLDPIHSQATEIACRSGIRKTDPRSSARWMSASSQRTGPCRF